MPLPSEGAPPKQCVLKWENKHLAYLLQNLIFVKDKKSDPNKFSKLFIFKDLGHFPHQSDYRKIT